MAPSSQRLEPPQNPGRFTGAGSRLANQSLKASAPDGRTFLIAPNSGPVFLDILYPRTVLGYDVLTDFAPVATLTTFPLGMVVQSSLGVQNAREYVAWAHDHPKEASFGSAGAGSHTHFAGMQLAQATGISLQVIPYRGNGPVNVDLQGGQLPAAIMAASDFAQYRNNPKLRIIGIFSKQRSSLVPEVPTFVEQGINAISGDAWMGMWTSANTPKADIDRMQNALKKILATPEFEESLRTTLTMEPMFKTAAEMDKLQRAELQMWRPIIKASGFTPER
ncbi:MAG: tripartite tricarboxylate transporter substrate-binding protein [Rhodoferax sp.]|nr:tripartite tricarboxylate transporter substrate-binding protein [Rhodoferax sp.]